MYPCNPPVAVIVAVSDEPYSVVNPWPETVINGLSVYANDFEIPASANSPKTNVPIKRMMIFRLKLDLINCVKVRGLLAANAEP